MLFPVNVPNTVFFPKLLRCLQYLIGTVHCRPVSYLYMMQSGHYSTTNDNILFYILYRFLKLLHYLAYISYANLMKIMTLLPDFDHFIVYCIDGENIVFVHGSLIPAFLCS